jgi:hypothetical protein
MASDSEHGSVMIARPSRWRPLDLQLMRVVLRVYSTAEYDEEEGRLQELVYDCLGRTAFRDLGRITDEERSELLIQFTGRWRSGRLTGFSRCYVRWALMDVRNPEEAATRKLVEDGQEQSEAAHDRRGLSPDAIVLVKEIEARFQGSLTKDLDRELFDAWIENGNRQGWQREFAQLRGRSDKWVSHTLKRFRQRLKEEHEVHDPDAFVDLLGSLRDVEDGPPLTHPPVEEETVPEEAPGERALVLRERLRESRQCFPDEEALLLALHQRYICLGRELASELKHAQEATDHE